MEITKISIDKIKVDKNQPRKDFQDIGVLSSSILKEGMLEPLKVRKEGKGFIVVDGERRFRALNLLAKEDSDFKEVDCIIISPKEVFMTQLSTDLHKKKLGLFEEAEAFKKLLEDGWSIEDIKSRLSIQTSTITKRIKLLGLDGRTKKMIKDGIIPASVVMDADFKTFKGKEYDILKRVKDEVGFINVNNSREKIKRIIKEEIEKEQAVINHLRVDLENFSNIIKSYDFKLTDFKLTDFKLTDYLGESIQDTQKILHNTLWKVEQLIGIKERLLKVKDELDNLRTKYGGNIEIQKEMFTETKRLEEEQ